MSSNTQSLPWPVTGHDWAVSSLQSAASAGRPPHALLITGQPNVGKGTLARCLAQSLLCTEAQRPCGACRACRLVAAGTHPDLRWVEPEGNSLKVEQVRELTRQLVLAPVEGPWQIAVLDRFEAATPGAANALLKTLEEPPPTVVLALLAQQAEALLPTIVSRCQVVALRPIPRLVIERALREQWQVEAAQARLVSHVCGGRLGWAVSAATGTELLERRQQQLDELGKLLRSKRVERFAYAEALARRERRQILESLEFWTGWWRDVLLLSSHSPATLTNVDRQEELRQTASLCDVATAHAALCALQAAQNQLALNANARLTLEVLLLCLPFFQS